MLAGILAAAGIAVVHTDAPLPYAGLSGRGLPLVIVSGAAGIASIGLMVARRFILVRITAAITVAAVLWGWGAAQYPHVLLPGMTVAQAAAPRATLQAALACVIVGMVLLIPSLTWLFVLFQRSESRFRNPV